MKETFKLSEKLIEGSVVDLDNFLNRKRKRPLPLYIKQRIAGLKREKREDNEMFASQLLKNPLYYLAVADLRQHKKEREANKNCCKICKKTEAIKDKLSRKNKKISEYIPCSSRVILRMMNIINAMGKYNLRVNKLKLFKQYNETMISDLEKSF